MGALSGFSLFPAIAKGIYRLAIPVLYEPLVKSIDTSGLSDYRVYTFIAAM